MLNKITKGIASVLTKVANILKPPEERKLTKYEIFSALLQKSPLVSVMIDPSKEGVILPSFLMHQESVVLQYGWNLATPIPDFQMGEDGIAATLSFKGKPSYTFIPWAAVIGMMPGNPPPIGPTSGPTNIVALKGGKYEEVKKVDTLPINDVLKQAA